MDTPKRSSPNKRVHATEAGAVRYYWRMWGWILLTLPLAVLLIGISISVIRGSLLLPQCFLLLFLPTGLGLLYITVALAINYTEFRVEGGELLVQHKPLPWRGNLSSPSSKIERINIGLHVGEAETGERSATAYLVSAIERKDGKGRTRLLISGLKLENAEALGWELENVLGISHHHPDREKRISSLKERLTKYNSRQKG